MPPPAKRLTDYASCAGCAGKLAPQGVSRVLEFLPARRDPNLLVGTETHDDAGVYRLTDEIALVQTIDFFPPVVDDPFIYGQIAAANALSDVYAMGGTPKTVLNLLGYPDDELTEMDWLRDILRGAAERCEKAGAVIVGGHSVRDHEIKFGLSVTGIVHPDRIWTNAGARPGDKLVLTKALGTGFITSAARKEACPEEVLIAACASMVQLNLIGRDAGIAVGGVHAVTDVTGFGLAGHGFEMAEGSKTTLVFELPALPVLPGLEEHRLWRYRSRASKSNAEYVQRHSRFEGNPDPVRAEILWDPQTSGGLLISISANRAKELVQELLRLGAINARVIGEVRLREESTLVFRTELT